LLNLIGYRLALFPNNQSIRRRSNCQRDAASFNAGAVTGEFRLRKRESNGTFQPVTELICIETRTRREPEEMPSGERIRNHGRN
jgi:hypothetical protein